MRLTLILVLAILASCDDATPPPPLEWEVVEKAEPAPVSTPVLNSPLTSTVFYTKEMSDSALTDEMAESGSRITVEISAWKARIFNAEMTAAEKEVFNIMYQQTDEEFLWVTIDERIFGHTATFECSNSILRWKLPDGSIAKCNGKLLHFMFANPDDQRVHRRYTSLTEGFRLRLSPAKTANGVETVFNSEGSQFNNLHITMRYEQ